MNQITRLKVQGFRRLADVDIELRPLNVLIGANGCGKTSFLEFLEFLSKPSLEIALSDMGGLTWNLTRGIAEVLSFDLNWSSDSLGSMQWDAMLEPRGGLFSVGYERLTFQNSKQALIDFKYGKGRFENVTGEEVRWDHIPSSFCLYVSSKISAQPIQALHDFLEDMSFPFLNDLTRRSPLRTTQQIRPASGPGNDGETLFAFLYSLKEDHPDSFEVIMDTLRAAFPSLESIKLPSVGAGIVSLTWKDRNFSQPFYMNELSEGTLRFLWLVCILANPTPATVTIIDEPEVSLHPEMLALLVPLMREASKRTQLFVATHSDRLVRHLQPEELIVFDLNEEGEAELKRGNDATLNIDEWMKDFTLDELWSMGQIGGR